MTIPYTRLPTQLGAVLRISRKRQALFEHAREAQADLANSDRDLLSAALGFLNTETDEARTKGGLLNHLDTVALPQIRALWNALRTRVQNVTTNGFFRQLADDLNASAADRNVANGISYGYEDTAGAIQLVTRSGILGRLFDDMTSNSESVLPNTVTPSAIQLGGNNRGVLDDAAVVAGNFQSHCLSGNLEFLCTDETFGAAKLTVRLVLDKPLPDGTTVLSADNLITPDKSFDDGRVGLSGLVLDTPGLASPTITGDGFSLFSAVSFATPSDGDSDLGIFHITVTKQSATAPEWLVEVFADSARTIKVGFGTHSGTSGSDVGATIEMSNGTVMTYTFNKTNAEANLGTVGDEDDDISFDVDAVRVDDFFIIPVSNDEAGNFSTKIAQWWRIELPTSGTPTFTDSLAASISMS